MAEPITRFQYPETVPEADRLPEELVVNGLDFFKKLFRPFRLPTIAAENYKEWKYAPVAEQSSEYRHGGMTGVKGLIGYRLSPPIHHPVHGHPKLIGYDVIGVPLSESFPIPESTGKRVGGFFFRSYFRLPPTEELPPGIEEAAMSLILEEHLVFDDDDKVAGRMYRPRGAQGEPIGRFSDTPNYMQHDLVGDQIAAFASGQPLQIVTARQAFKVAYPHIEFTSPEPPPFLESLQRP